MNLRLNNRSPLHIGMPFRSVDDRIFFAYKCAVILRYLLVCGTSAYGNERPKHLNSRSMIRQARPEKVTNNGSIVHSVMSGALDLPKRWSESGAHIGFRVPQGVGFGLTSGVGSVGVGKPVGKVIGAESANKGSGNTETASDQSKVVTSDRRAHAYFIIFAGGFAGLGIGAILSWALAKFLMFPASIDTFVIEVISNDRVKRPAATPVPRPDAAHHAPRFAPTRC